MNSKLSSKVFKELVNDEYFACLSSHKDRLSYILEEKLSFQKLRNSFASTVATLRKKAGKSLIKAKQFSDEAHFFASITGKGSQIYLNEALQFYKKVRCFIS